MNYTLNMEHFWLYERIIFFLNIIKSSNAPLGHLLISFFVLFVNEIKIDLSRYCKVNYYHLLSILSCMCVKIPVSLTDDRNNLQNDLNQFYLYSVD